MAMQPVPDPLISAARQWHSRKLYWITRHGIRVSGMPAWQYHLSDADLWAVTAFLVRLPGLTPTAYAELVAEPSAVPPAVPTGAGAGVDSVTMAAATSRTELGRLALRKYGCHACHIIRWSARRGPASPAVN